MPRYYCDYCDTYLTHDSPSVRKQHNAGYKHKANVRAYYQQFEEQQTQSLIDQKVKEHLGQAAAYHQVGSSFHHHFGAMQSGQYRPPTLPIPTSAQALNNPAMRHRPPVFPRPNIGPPGYSGVPSVASSFRPPGAPVSPTSHTSTPGFPGLRQATPSSAMANAPISTSKNTGTYQIQQPNSFPTSGLGAYGTSSNVLPPAGFSQQGTAYVLPNHIYEEAPRVAPYALSDSSMPSNAAQGNYIYNQIPTSAPCNESTAKPAASPPGTS